MNLRCFTRLIIAVIPLFSFLGTPVPGAGPPPPESSWIVEPMKIDGNMAEWIDLPTLYVEDPGVLVGIANNGRSLYILLRFKEMSWARAIRMSGLTLWFDREGKKHEKLGMRYTGGLSFPDMEKPSRGEYGDIWDRMPRELRQRFMEQMGKEEQIVLIDRANDLDTIFPVDGSKGPAAAFDAIPGTYTYEFKIPIGARENDAYTFPLRPGQTMTLGLKWGMDKDQFDRMRKEMGGGGPMDDHMRGPEKQEIWLDIRLAEQPVSQENKD